eukprot:15341581-Ditylum_brightwellii.AAC.1
MVDSHSIQKVRYDILTNDTAFRSWGSRRNWKVPIAFLTCCCHLERAVAEGGDCEGVGSGGAKTGGPEGVGDMREAEGLVLGQETGLGVEGYIGGWSGGGKKSRGCQGPWE